MIDDELDKLMAVMEAAFNPHWREAWTRTQVADSLMFGHTHYQLVDFFGDTPAADALAAGFTLVRTAPGEEELLLIAVHPDARGRGIGTQLLDRAAEAARTRGAERLFLEMRSNNPAQALYLKAGYLPIGRRKNYYRIADGTQLDAITFALKLS